MSLTVARFGSCYSRPPRTLFSPFFTFAFREEPMHSDRLTPRLSALVAPLRWVIPVTLCLLGLSYTFWESVLWDGYPITSGQVLLGVGLLGITGPLLTFLTLTWAYRAAASYEESETARERQYQQLLALNRIGESVSQSLDLDVVLNRAIEEVLAVMHLTSGEVRLIENGRLVLRTARGVSSDFISAEQTIPLGHCLCGKCAALGELMVVEDGARGSGVLDTGCAVEQFRSWLSMPVRTADRVVGVIHIGSRVPRTFDAADRALLAAIGQQVGAAIDKARLHSEVRALNQQLEARVVERTGALVAAKEELAHKADALRQVLTEERRVEERTRSHIAHDLHDGIQQIIIGALFQVQAAREALTPNPSTAMERLDAAQELLHRIESEMRGAIYSLRPMALDAQGLVPALRECATSAGRAGLTPCELQVEGTPRRFNPDAEVAVFRIVQEAMNNLETHAHAQRARVSVCFDTRELRVQVVDDGQGFDVSTLTQQARTHLGLIGMQERAESVGGTLQVSSRVGEGTCVTLNIPI
jgi:signal transduction histidine kinase